MADNTVVVRVDLNKSQFLEKIQDDRFGLFVANEWKRLIDPYTPHDTGALQNNVTLKPFTIQYNSVYAHYIYAGEIYIDPVYKVGGFYTEGYGWWSRPGVKKIPSGRSFTHFTRNTNPNATDHWDDVAANSGQLDKLTRTLNSALNSKRRKF